MHQKHFPVIDMVETGKNIMRLREERGMTVRDLQAYFGFEEPQAIYKWQRGKSLPTVDNLYALGALLDVPMEDILVPANAKSNIIMLEQQEEPCCSNHFWAQLLWTRQESESTSTIFADTVYGAHEVSSGEYFRRAQHQTVARRHHVTLHVGDNSLRSEDRDVWLGVRLLEFARWRIGCFAWGDEGNDVRGAAFHRALAKALFHPYLDCAAL